MARHLSVRELGRANMAVALTLVWGGVLGCAIAAAVYDVGRWVDAW